MYQISIVDSVLGKPVLLLMLGDSEGPVSQPKAQNSFQKPQINLIYKQMTPTILVVEDDSGVRQGIVDVLAFAGYNVIQACDGKEGMEAALSGNYQLMLLDLVMPHHSGFEVLEAIKKLRAGQPVIILSAKGEEADRVKGLTMGADDYIVKPFSVRELLARVDAVLRRTTERPSAVATFSCPAGVADFERCEIIYGDGSREELSDKEVELLRYLAANSGRAVARDEILRQVWGLNPKGIATRTIDMHVANLRHKLKDQEQEVLVTVRGKGYMVNKLCKSA